MINLSLKLGANKFKTPENKQPNFKGWFDYNELKHEISIWVRESQLYVRISLGWKVEPGSKETIAAEFTVQENKAKNGEKHPDFVAKGIVLLKKEYEISIWNNGDSYGVKINPLGERAPKKPAAGPFKKTEAAAPINDIPHIDLPTEPLDDLPF